MNTAVAPDTEPEGTAALEATAAAAGSLALPVLGWSLFTLKTTGEGCHQCEKQVSVNTPVVHGPRAVCAALGCGLPPGPSGLLGAAEGMSYLVVTAIASWSVYSKVRLWNTRRTNLVRNG